MFDFLDEDWFIIGLEVVFLVLIAYDVKKYIETKKKEYITNAVLTIGFAIWTLLPFYNSYFGWNETQKQELILTCQKENNETLCKCLSESSFKEFGFDKYNKLDKDALGEFIKDTKEECLDDSWF